MALARTHVAGAVWLVLVVATGLSWWLGADHTGGLATIGVLAVAFFKVRLIGLHFMELRGAPTPLRAMFEGYVVLVPVALAVVYLVA